MSSPPEIRTQTVCSQAKIDLIYSSHLRPYPSVQGPSRGSKYPEDRIFKGRDLGVGVLLGSYRGTSAVPVV